MKLVAVSVLTLSFAFTASAQITPGFVVQAGAPFPIVADFDGDGLDDLVQEHNVLLNRGGSLSELRSLELAQTERVVGVLDVNGDHILDLVTEERGAMVPPSVDPNARPGDPLYRLYILDAARNFAKVVNLASSRPYAADVDDDGKDDFVILADIFDANRITIATEVRILRSRGDGTFERLAPFRIAANVQNYSEHRVLSGDLDRDGKTDLVLRATNDLIILRGIGGGQFAVDDYYLPMTAVFGWWSTRLGDIDGDSNLDVVVVAQRGVRVLFGDGRGNFPRMATANIAKLHDPIGLPAGVPFMPFDSITQPKDLAVGRFTRSDAMQIAAGTVEGDIVVFSYEEGVLKEVARRETEFWHLTLRSGNFTGAGGTDLYAMGTLIWGDNWPRPRVFFGADQLTTANRTPARRRAVSRPASESTLQLQLRGDCISDTTERFTFTREGVFARAERGDTKIDMVFDSPSIYFRLTAPYTTEPTKGVITKVGENSYRGVAEVSTACGMKTMTVTATVN